MRPFSFRWPLVVVLFSFMTALITDSSAWANAGRPPDPVDAQPVTAGYGATASTTLKNPYPPTHSEGAGYPFSPRVAATRVQNCGPPQVAGHISSQQTNVCAIAQQVCAVTTPAQLPKDPRVTTQITLTQQPDGSWTPGAPQCNVVPGQAARPQVTAQMATDEARRLLPHPDIRTTGGNSPTLVNIETVFWIDTPADRTLGMVALLGYQVSLRAHVTQVSWDFGDGSTDTTDNPEPAYRSDNPCDTVTCADYYGHTYRDVGAPTITATITWNGQYRVDGGPWIDIVGTVSAPATSTTINVRQARGILVPNPDH